MIDTAFVVEHYCHDAKSKAAKLREALKNKTKVLVLFPDVVPLTQRFCEAVKQFVSMVEENSVFREMLNEIATYENYFEAQAAAEGNGGNEINRGTLVRA